MTERGNTICPSHFMGGGIKNPENANKTSRPTINVNTILYMYMSIMEIIMNAYKF